MSTPAKRTHNPRYMQIAVDPPNDLAQPTDTKTAADDAQLPHFLRLSGELRNKIYEYTFTYPAGLQYQEIDWRSPNCAKSGFYVGFDEANQLKYCNKQLYRETAGLEIKYNRITFHRKSWKPKIDNYSGPGTQFLGYMACCTPKGASWIQNIILSSPEYRVIPDPEGTLSAVIEYCRANPTRNVRYIFHNWGYGTWSKSVRPSGALKFIQAGFFLCVALRRHNAGDLLSARLLSPAKTGEALKWGYGIGAEVFEVPSNFQVWSSETEISEEFVTKLRQAIRGNGLNMGEAELVELIDLARDWVQNGIRGRF